MNLPLLGSWQSQEASRKDQVDKANIEEQRECKPTSIIIIHVESATVSAGYPSCVPPRRGSPYRGTPAVTANIDRRTP